MEEVTKTKEKKEKTVRKPRVKKMEAKEEVVATAVPAETVSEEPKKKKAPVKKKKTAEEPKKEEAKTEEVQTETPAPEKAEEVKEEKPKKKAPVRKKKTAEEPKKEEAKTEEIQTETPAPEKAEEVKAEAPEQQPPVKEKQATHAEKNDAVKGFVREVLQSPCKRSELLEKVAKLYQEKYPEEKAKKINDLNGHIGSIVGQMKKDGELIEENGSLALKGRTETEAISEKKTETPAPVEKKEEKKQAPVYDLTMLSSPRKPVKTEHKEEKKEAPVKEAVSSISEEKAAEEKQTAEKKSAAQKAEKKAKTEKLQEKKQPVRREEKIASPTMQKEDGLKEEFLKRLRSLGGEYLEYYSVYLLEKYSRLSGRRLEGMKVSGGDHDGGIDGEIEVTDRMGFRETIYIQAKNWNPTTRKWVVGETDLQQFIGAVTYRAAKEGKQHARGVYITTSRFTPEAREMLQKLSDKFVGYDGDDLYETAKECSFGVKIENGVYKVDEKLLSGEKAFFNLL